MGIEILHYCHPTMRQGGFVILFEMVENLTYLRYPLARFFRDFGLSI